MRRNQRSLLWLGISILAVLTLSTALLVEASPDSETDGPVTTDWSHHHLIFSRPATAERAERVEQDPRYWQQLRRQFSASLPEVEDMASQLQTGSNALSTGKTQALKRDWAEDMGSSATVGAGNYPAKFSFSVKTASCANDFVVYSTGLSGTGGVASIVAYNNLYSGCAAPVPGAYWAYETGGQILTSPVLSTTGSQVAFVQTNGTSASLVLMKWKAFTGTLGAPVAPASEGSSAYPNCTAPCMITFPLVDVGVAANDTNSSPFYDYAHDVAYVGDNSGYLHKFTPVFLGASGPMEVTTGGWPVKVNSNLPPALTSPVYDSVSTNVFVENKGGHLHWVNSTGTPIVTQSGLLDHSAQEDLGPGFVQGPVVDSAAGLVYVFATSDGSAGCLPAGSDCSVVYQTTTSFAGGVIPANKAGVGVSTVIGTAPNPMYIGAFDSSYHSSTDPPTGNLYVCGNTGVNPILYRVPITAGAFGKARPILPATPAADHPACSPVTDVSNPNTTVGTLERVFFSVQNNGLPTPCSGAGGCALSFVDTPWQAATPYNVGQEILVLRGNGTPWIQVAVASTGNSGATEPGWPGVVGATTPDGGVTWLTQGLATLTPLASWTPGTLYAVHDSVLDDKGNVEIVTKKGTSGGTAPNWNTTAGGTTFDGTVTWINAGVSPSAALAATGGTSGFIIDNVVGSGMQVGASQVYFSTLGSQACTGGTGGCAVQASQSALK